MEPLFGVIESPNERIAEYDRRIEQIAKKFYPPVDFAQTGEGHWNTDCVDLNS